MDNVILCVLKELIESETTKKNERDTSEWKQLMDKNMNKITDDSLKRLTLFEKNESELVNQRRITKDHAINLRMEISKKNIVSENKFRFYNTSYNYDTQSRNVHIFSRSLLFMNVKF